jgi:hypothetical protein
VEVILLIIRHTTKATNQEMDQMDQLLELIPTKVEFIAQVDQSAALQDQVLEPELMGEFLAPNRFLA